MAPTVQPSSAQRHVLPWRLNSCTSMLTGLLIILIVALSVGLGVGLTKRSGNNDLVNLSSTASLSPASPSSAPTAAPVVLQHGILNDSSFAALATPNSDRYIFFQDLNGTIRYAIYAQSSSTWVTNIDLVVATDAKNNTPLTTLSTTNPSVGNLSAQTTVSFAIIE